MSIFRDSNISIFFKKGKRTVLNKEDPLPANRV